MTITNQLTTYEPQPPSPDAGGSALSGGDGPPWLGAGESKDHWALRVVQLATKNRP